MKNTRLLILLGNQLFPLQDIRVANAGAIFMAEDLGLCTYERHHKLKILMFLASMREKRDELLDDDFSVDYAGIEQPEFDIPYEQKLLTCIAKRNVTSLVVFEIEDKAFELRLKTFAAQNNMPLEILPSPMFLLTRDEFLELNQSLSLIHI